MPTIAEKLALAAVTDSFNREENPIGAPWVKINPATSSGKCQIAGSIGYTPVTAFATGEDDAYWSTSPFSTAGEKYIYAIFTMTRVGSSERQTGVWLCRDETKPVETQNGYLLRLERKVGANEIKFTIEKWTAGVSEVIKELTTTEFIAGAKIALVVGGGKVYMFASTTEGGTFEEKMSVASATYTKGYSGVRAKGTGEFVIKDFRTGAFELVETPTPSRIAVTRELPPTKLALRVGPRAAGARWAEDEPSAENVLSDVELSDEMPGGCKELTGTLGRNPQLNWADLIAYGDAYAYLPGVQKVWQGSMDKTPDVSGDQMSINPALLGYQAVLEDNQAAQFGGINADVSQWVDPSLSRRKQVLLAGYSYQNTSISPGFKDQGSLASGLQVAITEWTEAPKPLAEAFFHADGLDIGKVLYDFNVIKAAGTASLENKIFLSTDDIVSAFRGISANYVNTETLKQTLNASAAGAKYAVIQFIWLLAGAGTNNGDSWAWTNLKVLGNHGIEPQGIWPNVGLSAKAMIEYVINNLAEPLFTESEYIDDDGYLIPHAWYGDMGSVSDIIKDILKYGLYDWFVYNGKRFELRKPGSYGKYWKAYVGPSNLNEVGQDSQRLWRSIVVTYQDVDGTTKTVGPLGSGATVETSELEITDPEHPAVKAERTRRDVLDLQGIGVPSTAIAVGKRFLEEANLINRSGSATLQGYVLDQYGVFWPSACVKSGDWISFVDAADRGYRKIVNKTYRHSERSAEIDLDAPASGLEALLERLQAGLISLGVS